MEWQWSWMHIYVFILHPIIMCGSAAVMAIVVGKWMDRINKK